MFKKLYPDTLLKKCIYLISAATVILFFSASVLMSNWYNRFMLPERQRTYSVITEAISTKISYILHQNTQYLLRYLSNTSLMDQVIAVSETSKDYTAAAELLTGEYYGSVEGSVAATRELLLLFDREDNMICRPEFSLQAEIIQASDWFDQMLVYFDDWKKEPESCQTPRIYSPVLHLSQEHPEQDFLAYAIYRTYNEHEFIFLMIEPLADFQNILKTFDDYQLTDYCLIGKDNRILYQNTEDSAVASLSPDKMQELFSSQQYTVTLKEEEQTAFLGSRISFPIEDLKIAASIPNHTMLAPYNFFLWHNIAILTAFTLLLIVAVFFIVWTRLRRLGLLAGQMKEVRSGTYHLPREITGTDEVGLLADTFYNMLDKINDDITIIQEKEKNEKRIQYSLMVSQVNPHFIYNTLNTITYLAELDQTEDIKIINCSLISMLRDRLRTSTQHAFDFLEKELEQLQNYVTIQKYLCPGELTLEMQVQPECMSLQFPRHILQPLVENAILHGILIHRDENRHRIPGLILLRIYLENDTIVTQLRDNGTGMSEETIQKYFVDLPEADDTDEVLPETTASDSGAQKNSRHEHIGIYNIRNRLMYLFGESFRIHAENVTDGSGTLITLRLPVQSYQQNLPPQNINDRQAEADADQQKSE